MPPDGFHLVRLDLSSDRKVDFIQKLSTKNGNPPPILLYYISDISVSLAKFDVAVCFAVSDYLAIAQRPSTSLENLI